MKVSAVLMCLVLVSGVAVAQNAGEDGGDASAQITGTVFFPYHNSAADVNAYLAVGLTAGQATRATDDCLAGDQWATISIGLPGPSVDVGVTDGTSEGCSCVSHSGGYDLSADTSVGGAVAITVGRYLSGADVFPASWSLLFRNTATQVRGIDCSEL